jgi:Icc protein
MSMTVAVLRSVTVALLAIQAAMTRRGCKREPDVPTKIIVLTDLHMVPAGERIAGLDPHERLRRAVGHINAVHPDAARVIVTGDLTHRGDLASYLRLRPLLDELGPPVSLMIGNHDRRDVFAECFPEAPRDEHGFVQQSIALSGDDRLLLLDTVISGTHAGALCDRRLAWLDAQLSGTRDRQATLFMHHPPHPVGFAGMDGIALQNGDAFYEVVFRYRNVRHLVAGHVHRTISGSFRGLPFSIFKSTVDQQPMDFGLTDTSVSVAEPGAYGILLFSPDGVVAHTDDFELSPTGGAPHPIPA